MNLDLTAQWISHWEGTRSLVYNDTKGIPTIGVGFNLTTGSAPAAISALGLDFDQVVSGAVSLSPDQISRLLQDTIQNALTSARNLVPNFDSIPENQQLVVADLVFNMGQTGLSKFVHTLTFIQQQDWTNAARNLQQSLWFTQVGAGPKQRGGADVAVLGGAASPSDFLTP